LYEGNEITPGMLPADHIDAGAESLAQDSAGKIYETIDINGFSA